MRIDPEENELHHLLQFAPLAGRRILDIGCGDGSFTSEYAEQALSVTGMDPDLDDLRLAIRQRPEDLAQRVHFLCARAQALPFPDETFEVVLFTSSL